MLDTPAPTAPQELLDRAEASADGTLVRYDRTVAELATLTQKYGSAVFNCALPEQDKAARAARKELVTLRTSLEAKRKEIKAPFLAVAKEIDEKAKSLESEILALEQPIDAQIKIEEAQKKAIFIEIGRIEHERVIAIKTKIEIINRVRISALTMSAPQIEAALAAEFDFSDFDEFQHEARAAHEETVSALQSMLQIRMEQESEHSALAKAQAELLEARALLAAERADQDRVQALANAAIETQKSELARQLEAIKAKDDAAQAAERLKNMASELAKARLCSAAPKMLKALKMVFSIGSLSYEAQAQVQEAIVAAEGL